MRLLIFSLLVSVVGGLFSACGQPGPLYRPGDVEAERRATGSDTQEAIDRIDDMREADESDTTSENN